ncbi:MAG TPA: hypothetical protein VN397_00365 [Candidatus Methylomirabilis sp.]|nr:hypothetical protein [Candidatus Methylomirabilis sp.]
MMTHATMAAGRWNEYSFAVQMANIGSDVYRAVSWNKRAECAHDTTTQQTYKQLYLESLERAIELIDLTRRNPPSPGIRKELGRVREAIVSAYLGTAWYDVTLESLNDYFNFFTLIAAKERHEMFDRIH